MRTIHFSDARSNLKTVIDQVVDDADVMLITRRDAPNAVILSREHHDSLMETVHLLRSPANVARLECSIAQLRNLPLSLRVATTRSRRTTPCLTDSSHSTSTAPSPIPSTAFSRP